jgi:hypothetical protein
MLVLEITEAITKLSAKELEKVKYAVRKEQKKRKTTAAQQIPEKDLVV